MTYQELCNKLNPYIQKPIAFKKMLNAYHYTSAPSAKTILRASLILGESENLKRAYYCEKGWFKKAHDEDGMKLMLAARALGLIHDDFYRYDKNKYEKILNLAQNTKDSDVDLLCNAYAKQKMVTCRALSMIRKKRPEILLYRGLRSTAYDGTSKKIYFNGLESYTSNLRVAKFFSGENGWILSRKCSIFDIFVYYTTLYRTTDFPSTEMKYKIHRAREYIVENVVPVRLLSDTLAISRSEGL